MASWPNRQLVRNSYKFVKKAAAPWLAVGLLIAALTAGLAWHTYGLGLKRGASVALLAMFLAEKGAAGLEGMTDDQIIDWALTRLKALQGKETRP